MSDKPLSILDQLDRTAPLIPLTPEQIARYRERMAEQIKPFRPNRRRRC